MSSKVQILLDLKAPPKLRAKLIAFSVKLRSVVIHNKVDSIFPSGIDKNDKMLSPTVENEVTGPTAWIRFTHGLIWCTLNHEWFEVNS